MADDLQMLKDAVARNSGVVFSIPGVGAVCHHKSRFLAVDEAGFWVESIAAEAETLAGLAGTLQPVGISFKSGIHKVIFATPVLRFSEAYKINEQTVVPAVFLAFPGSVKAIQRRNNYRVAVTADCGMSARVWRIGPNADLREKPMAAVEIACELRDISLGGMGVIFRGVDGEKPRVTDQDRLRIELRYNESAFLIEGQMRAPAANAPVTKNELRTGVLFKAMEQDIEGRRMVNQLTRFVGELHRDEVRRHRRGMMRAG